MTNTNKARALALALPAALLAGAWGSQIFGHLSPCTMCHWQRTPHYIAVPIALLAFVPMLPKKLLVALAALAIAVSGVIGVVHAGVEYHWWPGFTACSSAIGSGSGDMLTQIMNAPINRCDAAPWSLFGISLAGFNAIFSLGGAIAIFYLLFRGDRAR